MENAVEVVVGKNRLSLEIQFLTNATVRPFETELPGRLIT